MSLGLLNPFRAAINQLTGGVLGSTPQDQSQPTSPGQSLSPVAAVGKQSQAQAANAGQAADDIIQRRRNAIAGIESAGQRDPYRAIGATHPKYGRALGRYQMMEANIPGWTKRAIGRSVSPNEFLASRDIQDRTFDKIFGEDYVPKYGDEGAARAWYGGEKGMRNLKATDVHGRINVGGYGQQYMRNLGGKGQPARSTAGQTPASSPQMAADNAPQTGMAFDPQNPRGFVEQAVADAGLGKPGSTPEKPKNAFQQWLGNIGKGGSSGEEAGPPPLPDGGIVPQDAVRQERFNRVIEQVLTKQNSRPLRQMQDTDKLALLAQMGKMTATPFGGQSNG